MSNPVRFIGKTFVFVTFSLFLVSWTLPERYQELREASDDSVLDYVILDINGQLKKVSRNEELSFVRGDSVIINQAYLKNSKKNVSLVRIAGSALGVDQRMKTIDTASSMISKDGSVDSEGSVYPLIVQTQNILHGVVYLRRIEPVLSYIDVQVNGKNRVMREGEILQVKKSDHFKVVNVVSNIENTKNISFVVVPVIRAKKPDSNENYQIVFRHKDYVFAKIPLNVESL